MAIRLIALDMDGTLLRKDHTISPANQAALKEATSRGVQVVLTTGRPLPAILPYLETLGLVGEGHYAITFNGGLVQQNDGKVLSRKGLTYLEAQKLYELTQSLGIPLDLVVGEEVYMVQDREHSLYPTCNPLLRYQPMDFSEIAETQTFFKAVSCCDEAVLDQAIKRIPSGVYDQFEIAKSRPILLEWGPKGVHKATGLAELIAHLGIQQEEVMACGDQNNDLSMLEWAGLGVCMANGSADAKAAADVVTPMTNEEDAVAWAVKKFV